MNQLLLFFLVTIACVSLSCTSSSSGKDGTETSEGEPIGQYVVSTFEDSKGHLWFGTLAKGVARYDGNSLKYYTVDDGLAGNSILSMAEDRSGNLWLGTDRGLSMYDGSVFISFTEDDGLCHPRVANMLIDTKGYFWIGTWGGVCLFDGSTFIDFPMPEPEVDGPTNADTREWVTEIIEDRNGNIWFGRDGYGACRHDGDSLIHFTKKEGLVSNNVQSIEEDNDGNLWFGTRVAQKDLQDPANRQGPGGAQMFDGNAFIQFPDNEGLTGSDVFEIYSDDNGIVWISTIAHGLYKYDGNSFTNYNVRDDDATLPVQSILKDRNGTIWLGCSGGLCRLDSTEVVYVTTAGPW